MSKEPKCPYCGDKMELQTVMPEGGSGYKAWYQCVLCDSASPFIELPESNTIVKIEKAALDAALCRAVSENDTSDVSQRTEGRKSTSFIALPSGLVLNVSRIDGITPKGRFYSVFVGSNEAFRIDNDDYEAFLSKLHLSLKEDDSNGNQDEN